MPVMENAGIMTGVYVDSCSARFMRPVRWLKERKSGLKGNETEQADMNHALTNFHVNRNCSG